MADFKFISGDGIKLVGNKDNKSLTVNVNPEIQGLNDRVTTIENKPAPVVDNLTDDSTNVAPSVNSVKAALNEKANNTVATATENGLMSNTDKSKLDGISATGSGIGMDGLVSEVNGYSSARLPDGTNNALEYVEGLGLFRFNPTSTEQAEGETCIMPVNGIGRWLLILPDSDLLLSIFRRDNNALYRLIGTVDDLAKELAEEKAKPRLKLNQQTVSVSSVSVSANNSIKNSPTITSLGLPKYVTTTPVNELPTGINYTSRYTNSGTSIDIYFYNNTTATISVPANTWIITSLTEVNE